MILTCPNCGTQYVVKDGAVPPQGRQVRCASCKHSWHQDPEPVAEMELEPAMEAASEHHGDDESLAEATMIDPRSGPEAEERAYEEAAMEEDSVEEPAAASPDWSAPPDPEAQDDEFSPFQTQDEAEPKRRSPLLALLVVVVIIAAAFWFFAPPELKARIGLTAGGMSPLALVTTHMDRQRLESGNELLTVTGRVINPTSKDQAVPPLQAQLKSRAGRIVYSWTIAPPARSLPPGASANFNSAEVNVPPGGDELTITLGSPGR